MESIPFIDLKKQFSILRPQLEKALLAAAAGTQYIGGPELVRLEKELAEYAGVSEAVGCANGTDALMLPLLALGLKAGEAVFCPSFTFIATAEVAALRGAEPVFVDIDPDTYNMCPRDLEKKILAVKKEGRLVPKVIIPVDLFGLPADYPALNRIAEAHDLFVLEDAAQGFGGRIGEKRAGSFGRAGATSFFPAKPLGTYGDGGAILTSDRDLAEVLRSLRGHGTGRTKYEHVRLGVNSRLDTLQAAVLLVKLEAFPEELEARQKVAAGYSRRLEDAVRVPKIPAGFLSSWAQYTVRVRPGLREYLAGYLKERGIPANIYYPLGLHQQPAFAGLGLSGDCPETEKACREVLSLPMHPYLDEPTLDRICREVRCGLKSGAENV